MLYQIFSAFLIVFLVTCPLLVNAGDTGKTINLLKSEYIQNAASKDVQIEKLIEVFQQMKQNNATVIDRKALENAIKKEKLCTCSNNFTCNPSSPPPNCGKCTCVDL